jgi:hypothetical protein
VTAVTELITQEAFARIWAAVCVAWTLGWLVAAGIARLRGSSHRLSPLIPACLGPLSWGLWLIYRRTIAYDPESGIAGMHKVSVLLGDFALFVAVGVAVGWVLGRLASRRSSARESNTHTPPKGNV